MTCLAGYNRKGLNNIVSGILLILVGIMAVSVLWISVQNIINAPALSPKLNCAEMQTRQILNIQGACYNSSSGNLKVSVKRGTGAFDSVQFVINSDSGNSNWKCGTGCICKLLDEGQTKNYYFKLGGAKEVNILVNGCLIDKSSVNNC